MLKAVRKNNFFITGATGFIGRHLACHLLEQGECVSVLTRHPEKVPLSWKGRLTIAQGDLTEDACPFPDRIDVIFHCAGEIRDQNRFERVNVDGTRRVVDACLARPGCALVHLSSVGVMGSEGPGVVDETRPCLPKSPYEKTKYAAETIIQDAVRKKGLRAVILRPSIVYGPGVTLERDSFLALVRSVKKKRFCIFGTVPSYYNIIYVGDVVDALIALSKVVKENPGEVFIVNDAIEWRSFLEEVLSALGLTSRIHQLPVSAGYAAAFVCDIGKCLGMKMPFSMNRLKALTCKTIFDPKKLLRQFDLQLRYRNRQGIAITLQHYIKQGSL